MFFLIKLNEKMFFYSSQLTRLVTMLAFIPRAIHHPVNADIRMSININVHVGGGSGKKPSGGGGSGKKPNGGSGKKTSGKPVKKKYKSDGVTKRCQGIYII